MERRSAEVAAEPGAAGDSTLFVVGSRSVLRLLEDRGRCSRPGYWPDDVHPDVHERTVAHLVSTMIGPIPTAGLKAPPETSPTANAPVMTVQPMASP